MTIYELEAVADVNRWFKIIRKCQIRKLRVSTTLNLISSVQYLFPKLHSLYVLYNIDGRAYFCKEDAMFLYLLSYSRTHSVPSSFKMLKGIYGFFSALQASKEYSHYEDKWVHERRSQSKVIELNMIKSSEEVQELVIRLCSLDVEQNGLWSEPEGHKICQDRHRQKTEWTWKHVARRTWLPVMVKLHLAVQLTMNAAQVLLEEISNYGTAWG